jgi:hypothetical protein
MTDETLPVLPPTPTELVDVRTGEFLPATLENAAHVLLVAREMKSKITDVIRDTEAFLANESRTQGTKTFHTDFGKVELKGGESVEYDPHDLEQALREAGCPEPRIRAVVVESVSYSVDRRILRQLVAANPEYAAAAERASRRVESRLTASVKAPTGRGSR